jgi:protein arginine kinase activator
MKCDLCRKNEATVHLTEIINGKVTKLHICESCAKKKGAEMEDHFGLADLLAGLADFGVQFDQHEVAGLKCPNCGLKFNDFKRMGRLGCSECYETFKNQLMPLLKRIHGSDQHLGRAPVKTQKRMGNKIKIEELKSKLQKAVQTEEFEQAARLRDEIKKLEQEGAK